LSALFDRIYGCEAACTIANAMGDITEGNTYKQIEEKWGFVDKLLPQDIEDRERTSETPLGPRFLTHAHHRPPGMTEDGMERHRLATSAIIRKGGRITVWDLAETWVADIDPGKFGYLLGPQDQVIYYSLKAGVPPWEVGRYAVWPGRIGTAKMIQAVGMVNACNPAAAASDAFDVGRIKDVRGIPGNYALEVAAGLAAATAEALKPGATVDSVVATALSQLSAVPRAEVEQGLEWAGKARDWKELRPLYEERYRGHTQSNAVEVFSGGLACFVVTRGQPKEALLACVNLGRDTDCKAYVAGGLAGALRGVKGIPAEWIKVIDDEVVNDPHTVSRRTIRQAAEGLTKAAMNEIAKMKAVVAAIEAQG
jgi:ADP-ribosylglycohydrolase